MNVVETRLPGVVVVEPRVYRDERGAFLETWHPRRYADAGILTRFVQDNVSYSSSSVLRGLHLQHPFAQAKLISVLEGEVFDVAVDVRIGSPTFGRWVGVALSASNHHQLFVPAGFAHGFAVMGERATVLYKCDEFYSPADELGVAWDDPDIGIEWPTRTPLLSPKDAAASRLRDIPPERLPHYPAARRGRKTRGVGSHAIP